MHAHREPAAPAASGRRDGATVANSLPRLKYGTNEVGGGSGCVLKLHYRSLPAGRPLVGRGTMVRKNNRRYMGARSLDASCNAGELLGQGSEDICARELRKLSRRRKEDHALVARALAPSLLRRGQLQWSTGCRLRHRRRAPRRCAAELAQHLALHAGVNIAQRARDETARRLARFGTRVSTWNTSVNFLSLRPTIFVSIAVSVFRNHLSL